MIFSVIIPSFNQDKYIRETLSNVSSLKRKLSALNHRLEILVIDNNSNEKVQSIISSFRSDIDYLDVSPDKGQYDAINKGISKCSGHYWTWLNTDDLLNEDGFLKIVEILSRDDSIDYIYGGIRYIDDKSKKLFDVQATELTFKNLVHNTPGIFQPGSFFKKSFTDKIGMLDAYRCCFDYEYIVRCLKFEARFYRCDFIVSHFRYYNESKTGSLIPVFIREQLAISKKYGRGVFSYLTWFSKLRLLKHKVKG